MKREYSFPQMLLLLVSLVLAILCVVPGAQAATTKGNRYYPQVRDITGDLVNAGIIYKRTVTMPRGYTNLRTTLDPNNNECLNFYGADNCFYRDNSNRLDELVMDTNRIRFGANMDIGIGTFYQFYPTQIDLAGNEVPIFAGIARAAVSNKPGANWMGARELNRVWGYNDNGTWVVTHVLNQTKCSAGEYYFSKYPWWHPNVTEPDPNYRVTPNYWPDGYQQGWGAAPVWGWDGGALIGSKVDKYQYSWYYVYDVNNTVNGKTVSAAAPGVFNVNNGGAVSYNVRDFCIRDDILEGTTVTTSDIRADSGYVYVGSSSFSGQIRSDTNINLPFKTLYTLSYDKGETNNDVAMPASNSLVWDDSVTLPSVDSTKGRSVSMTFDTNKGNGSTTPSDVESINDTLDANGWKINGNMYGFSQRVDQAKFSDQPNGKVTASLSYPDKTFTLPETSRYGYDFDGWTSQPDGDNPVKQVTVSASKQAYSSHWYAHWTPKTYTITFKKNNPKTASEGDESINLSRESQSTKFDSAWGQLPQPTKKGYIFQGWYTEPDGGDLVTADTICHGPLTVYAHWTPITYTVQFDDNEENGPGKTEGHMDSITLTYDKHENLPKNQFTKTTATGIASKGGEVVNSPSTFKGWSLSATTFEPTWLDQGDTFNLAYTQGAVVTLHAIWDDTSWFTWDEFPDRYFSLSQAKDGAISEAELLSTIKVKDREQNTLPTVALHKPDGSSTSKSCGSLGCVTVVGWSRDDYVNLDGPATISVTYQAQDKSGNRAWLTITVYVTETGSVPANNSTQIRDISKRQIDTLSSTSNWASGAKRERLDSALDKAASDSDLPSCDSGASQCSITVSAETSNKVREQSNNTMSGLAGKLSDLWNKLFG